MRSTAPTAAPPASVGAQDEMAGRGWYVRSTLLFVKPHVGVSLRGEQEVLSRDVEPRSGSLSLRWQEEPLRGSGAYGGAAPPRSGVRPNVGFDKEQRAPRVPVTQRAPRVPYLPPCAHLRPTPATHPGLRRTPNALLPTITHLHVHRPPTAGLRRTHTRSARSPPGVCGDLRIFNFVVWGKCCKFATKSQRYFLNIYDSSHIRN